MDQSQRRKPERLSELAPDLLEQIRSNLIGTGKKRRKSTRQKSRKKKGGKRSRKKKGGKRSRKKKTKSRK